MRLCTDQIYLAPLCALVEGGEELVDGRRFQLDQRLACTRLKELDILHSS